MCTLTLHNCATCRTLITQTSACPTLLHTSRCSELTLTHNRAQPSSAAAAVAVQPRCDQCQSQSKAAHDDSHALKRLRHHVAADARGELEAARRAKLEKFKADMKAAERRERESRRKCKAKRKSEDKACKRAEREARTLERKSMKSAKSAKSVKSVSSGSTGLTPASTGSGTASVSSLTSIFAKVLRFWH